MRSSVSKRRDMSHMLPRLQRCALASHAGIPTFVVFHVLMSISWVHPPPQGAHIAAACLSGSVVMAEMAETPLWKYCMYAHASLCALLYLHQCVLARQSASVHEHIRIPSTTSPHTKGLEKMLNSMLNHRHWIQDCLILFFSLLQNLG